MKFSKFFEAQEKYCEDHGVEVRIPDSGKCDQCGADIFASAKRHDFKGDWTKTPGITVEEASEHLITNCPHCGYTF